jgi:hypothetical protein
LLSFYSMNNYVLAFFRRDSQHDFPLERVLLVSASSFQRVLSPARGRLKNACDCIGFDQSAPGMRTRTGYGNPTIFLNPRSSERQPRRAPNQQEGQSEDVYLFETGVVELKIVHPSQTTYEILFRAEAVRGLWLIVD